MRFWKEFKMKYKNIINSFESVDQVDTTHIPGSQKG